MTKVALRTFRKLLEKRRADLGIESGRREALAIEESPDETDRIQNSSDRDCAMTNLQRNSDRLREVQAAICRIDADTFGICAGCEEAIKQKRLAAVPWTSCCLACQEAADADQRAFANQVPSAA